MEESKSVKVFSSLNTDLNNLQDSPETLSDAVNVAFISEGDNQLVLHNLKGTEVTANLTDGYSPVGVGVFDGIAYILSAKYNSDGAFISGEVGTYPSPDWGIINSGGQSGVLNAYSPLMNWNSNPFVTPLDTLHTHAFRTNLFDLGNLGQLVEIELQPAYDDSVNIIIIDDNNPTRIINSRFKHNSVTDQVVLADRSQVLDNNVYNPNTFLLTELIKRTDKVVDLVYNGLNGGGALPGGGFKLFLKYADNDGNLTDIIEESMVVIVTQRGHGVAPGTNSGLSASFTLSNLDTRFSTVVVYISYVNSDDNEAASTFIIDKPYAILGGTMDIIIDGEEPRSPFDFEKLNIQYSAIKNPKTGVQKDGSLIIGNLAADDFDYKLVADLASQCQITQASDDMNVVDPNKGYGNSKIHYYDLGVWSGETYELAIVLIKKGGGLTPAFPCMGTDNFENYLGTSGYQTPGLITNASGYSSTGNTLENRLGAFRTKKNRELLNSDLTTGERVKLSVDISILQNSLYVQANTEGYFLVRKSRIKECLSQGFLGNVQYEPVGRYISSNGNYSIATPRELLGSASENHNEFAKDIHNGIGSTLWQLDDTSGLGYRKLPCFGRIHETTLQSKLGLDNTGKSVMTQGVLGQDPTGSHNGESNWSYYSADGMVNPANELSLFSGQQVGIYRGGSTAEDCTVTMNEDIGDGDDYYYDIAVHIKKWIVYIHYEHSDMEELDPGVKEGKNETAAAKIFVHWHHTSNTGLGSSHVYGRSGSITYANEPSIGSTYKKLISMMDYKVPALGTSNDVTSSNTFIYPTIDYEYNIKSGDIQTGTLTNLNIDTAGIIVKVKTNIVLKDDTGDTWSLIDDEKIKTEWDVYDDTYTVNIVTDQYNGVSQKLVSKLSILGGISFTPTALTSTYDIKASAYSISNNVDIDLGGFSSIADRNLYYYSGAFPGEFGKPFYKWSEEGTGRHHTGKFYVSNTGYANYVGIITTQVDDIIKLVLAQDPFLVINHEPIEHNFQLSSGTFIPGDGFIPTKQGHLSHVSQWHKRIKDGIAAAVPVKIYSSTEGPMTSLLWKSRYSSVLSSSDYSQCSKRFSWGSGAVLPMLQGDCYIGRSYKMPYRRLGVVGTSESGGAADYIDGNLDTSLISKGFVFPIITENNYNTVLRSLEIDKDGNPKTFYPKYPVAAMRSQRYHGPEKLNKGYSVFNSDLSYYNFSLSDPINNKTHRNRVYVSKANETSEFRNGYSDFSGLNYRDYSAESGPITKLAIVSNKLVAIFHNGIGTIPVNDRSIVGNGEGDGSEIYIDDASVLGGNIQMMSTEFGSNQQFSVIQTGTSVYGVDYERGKIWAVTREGFSILSDFKVQKVVKEYKDSLFGKMPLIKANYDTVRNDIVFSFYHVLDDTYGVGEGEPNEDDNRKYATLTYNESIGEWTTRLSYNPLWMFNINDDLLSFNALGATSHIAKEENTGSNIWKHFSNNVPRCHFYGDQHKFIVEFVLNAGPEAHKILDNFMFVCNRSFPGRVTYKPLDGLVAYESFTETTSESVSLLKRRHENEPIVGWDYVTGTVVVGVDTAGLDILNAYMSINYTDSTNEPYSKQESERIVKGYTVVNNVIYIIGASFTLPDGSIANYILDQNGNSILGSLPTNWGINTLEFGIIQQNMDYIEDHLYIEVNKGEDNSLVRDKGIRVRFMYEGYDIINIYSIITMFSPSFS